MDTSGLFRVDGLVAVVTGGGTGIGLVMTKALVGAGAKKVYILGRRREALESAAALHKNIVPVQCDVTDKASLQSVVDLVTKDVGYVNLLIANSGVLGPTKPWDNNLSISQLRKNLFEDVAIEDFTETFHVNISGTFFSILAFLELLDAGNKQAVKGGWGAPTKEDSDAPSIQSQVIVTSSISAFSRSPISTPAYAFSKAALVHLTKHTSSSLTKYGIRVNAMAPGLFPSVLAERLVGQRDPSKEAFEDPHYIPARKFGGEDEMAGSILYLASKAGSFCNGFILMNDGGRIAMMPATY